MKTIQINIVLLLFTFYKSNSQSNNNKLEKYTGNVKAFARTNYDFTNNIIDTIINQKRTILINKKDSIIEIGWQLENDNNALFQMTYKIEKEYIGNLTNPKTQLKSESHNYLVFDIDNYPLMIAMTNDKSYCYIYYFWDSNHKTFLKSEKVALN